MSYNNIIPEEVARFILHHIDSVAQMEAILLLRSNPVKEWSVEELAKRLYISEEQTEGVVSSLCARGIFVAILTGPPRYRYEPASKELDEMIERVAEVYSKHLVPVTNLIHSKPATRVQEFADAFKLRKDK
ncbi:MAG TPA: hypothetical protein VNO43_17910 [Candidatus Eisenbacteria bacterium]|nr:hypothetical protein [Candidatus Eisenbacteria bacterium]